MNSEELKLPSVRPTPPTSRISSLEDYKKWEESKKKAYHAELDREVEIRRKDRVITLEEKSRERVNMSAMVEEERTKLFNDKHSKIKTEQRYMQDNYQMMKGSRKSVRVKDWWGDFK